MRRFTLIAFIAALGAATSAQAQTYQECKRNNQALGAVAGAVVGGAAGGAIANNTRRGFRGGRFHRGRGFSRSRRGNQGLGIALGAIAGGVVGSQLANNANNCDRIIDKVHSDPFAKGHGHGHGHGFGHGVDKNAVRFGDPFGGRSMPYNGVEPAYGQLAGGPDPDAGRRECRQTSRTTLLPDGREVEEAIQVCRQGPDGAWVITENGF